MVASTLIDKDSNHHAKQEDREPIAIIGLTMRAADEATDAEALWDFLLRARQATRPIPDDRFRSKGFYHPDPNHGGTELMFWKFYVKGAGAGITSLIKSVLLLEAGIIPPNATLERINPNIPCSWNVKFPTSCIPWPSSGIRRSSISSYGISGTNAHCILDDAYHYLKERGILARHKTVEIVPSEAETELVVAKSTRRYERPEADNSDSDDTPITNGSPILLLFSAFDENSLEKVVAQIRKHVLSVPSQYASQILSDLAFTSSEKRSLVPWKTYALCTSLRDLDLKLAEMPSKPIKSRSAPTIGFVFTGQGAQYAQMGQQLLVYDVFRQFLEAANSYFRALGSDCSLLEELKKDSKTSRISKSTFAHPISCAVQIALLDLLISWNVIPHRVTGHSSGEIAAAYCAGRISREGAWRVAYFRGHVLQGNSSRVGGMLAAGIEEDPLRHLLEQVHKRFSNGTLSIACYNSPRNHTISGDDAMVDVLKSLLDEQGVFNRKLNVEHAAHSAHMEQFCEEYKRLVGRSPSTDLLRFEHPVHMLSTLTGRLLDDSSNPELASHWCDSMVRPVKFTEAIVSMWRNTRPGNISSAQGNPVDVILEVGPHPVMQSAVKEIIDPDFNIPYLSTLNSKDTGLDTLLHTIGTLVSRGSPVNLHKVNMSTNPSVLPKTIVDLPPYPFNHEEQGLYESRLMRNTRLRPFPRHDLFGAPVSDWNPNNPRWRHFLRTSENPWLKEHLIGDTFVFPGAGYLVMASVFGHVEWTDGHLPENKLQRLIIAMASGPQFDRLRLPPQQNALSTFNTADRARAVDVYVERFTSGFSMQPSTWAQVNTKGAGQCILVTGATGSLGAHLVMELLGRSDVKTVVCLNRPGRGNDPRQRQRQSMEEKGLQLEYPNHFAGLRIIETDTSKPRLGLSAEIYAELTEMVTAIVHNAWPMSGARPIRGFEGQFAVMRNLIDLARDAAYVFQTITFQFISSISVVGHSPLRTGSRTVPEERVGIESVLPNGYSDAKFVCERMLDATLYKHPEIFRPMCVAGSSKSGYWNSLEHFSFLIKSSQTLRAFPNFQGELSWTPVDVVTSTLADLISYAASDFSAASTVYPIYHIDNPVRQPWRQMVPVLAAALNIPPSNILPFTEWVSRVRRFPGSVEKDNPAFKLIDFLDDNFVRMSCGGLLLDTLHTQQHSPTLASLGPISNQTAERYIQHWKATGFLAA
ncbi:polyketide synthase [Penicillium herquei]|nr:polyketide synthase [Penicillium herquei]